MIMRRIVLLFLCFLLGQVQTALAAQPEGKVNVPAVRSKTHELAPPAQSPVPTQTPIEDTPAPLPDYLNGKPVQLNAKERKALGLANEWEAKSVPPSRDGKGKVVFVHGASLPTIIAAPLNVTDVELQPGETVNEVLVGDSARWLVEVGKSGAAENATVHLLIKPVDAGLESSAVVTTSRRVYHLRLVSQRSEHTPYVGFIYQEDQVKRYQEQAAKDAKEKHWKTTEIDGENLDLSKLNFAYAVKGKASWKPTQVYDNGQQTIIRLPHASKSGEMPILLVRKGSNDVLVNYRVKGQSMILDGLFEKVVLVVGVGGDQEKVEILREKS